MTILKSSLHPRPMPSILWQLGTLYKQNGSLYMEHLYISDRISAYKTYSRNHVTFQNILPLSFYISRILSYSSTMNILGCLFPDLLQSLGH